MGDVATDREQNRIALLIGGNTRYCSGFTEVYASKLATQLAKQAELWRAKYVITNSRRTPDNALQVLRSTLCDYEAEFVDSKGVGYPELLARTDAIICTGDSLSMCSEAAITGKPLLITTDAEAMEIYHLQAANRLIDAGYAIQFCGTLESLPRATKALDTTGAVGTRILEWLRAGATRNMNK